MYYLLSGYICVLYCVKIYIYITIYLSIYLLIYFIYLSFFIYSHVVLYCFLFIIYVYIYREREIIYHFRDQTLPPPAWLQVAAASDWALRSLLWATPRQLSETQQRGLRIGKRQWKVELSVEGLVSYKK
jgi:hypothetical protein